MMSGPEQKKNVILILLNHFHFLFNVSTKQWFEVTFVTRALCPATESSHMGYIVMKYECQTGVSLSTDAAITKEELKTLN